LLSTGAKGDDHTSACCNRHWPYKECVAAIGKSLGSRTVILATPPEVLFDRFFRKAESWKPPIRPEAEDPDSRIYKGKKDLNSLPQDMRELLSNIQQSFNEALLNEKTNVRSTKWD
jgi:hypothetical protein